MFTSLFKASAVYAAGSFIAKFGRLLLIPIYVRYLSPDEVGMIVFIEAVIYASNRFFPIGLGHAVKRFYFEFATQSEADSYASTLWATTLLIAVFGASLLILGLWAFPQLASSNVPVLMVMAAILLGAFRSSYNVPLQRLIARREAGRHVLCEVGEIATTATAIAVAIVFFDLGVFGYFVGYAISVSIWTLIFAVQTQRAAERRFHRAYLPSAFRYSIPLWPHAMFAWAITFLDRIILERLVPLAEVGIYGIGYQLASVVPVATLAIVHAWMPRFFSEADTDRGMRQYIAVLRTFATLIAAAVTLMIFAAPVIVSVIAGTEYRASVQILQIISIGLGFHALYQGMILVLLYEKKGVNVSLSSAVALIVNVGLLLWLVPKYGILAAAWATVAAFASASLLVGWQVVWTRRVSAGQVAGATFPVLVGAFLGVLAVLTVSQWEMPARALFAGVTLFLLGGWWYLSSRLRSSAGVEQV